MSTPDKLTPSILIVDDDSISRDMLRRVLEPNGYRIEESVDATEGLAKYQEIHPTIVLLDAMMPGINGFEMCARLQSLSQSTPVPVIMITALNDDASVERAFKAGATDYITKPVHWPALLQRVQRLVQTSQAVEALQAERTLLRTVIDNLPDYIIAEDLDGRFSLSNVAHTLAARVGKSEDMIGKTAFDFFPPNLAEQWASDDLKVLGSGEALLNLERTIIDAFGKSQPILTTKVPIRNVHGEIQGLVALSRDISDQKRMENELRTHRDTLEKLVEERTRDLTNTNEALQREIGERERIAEQLRQHSEFERIMATISTEFIMRPPDEIRFSIDNSLEIISKFVQAMRSYVCIFDDENIIDSVYEYCHDSREPEVIKLKGRPKQALFRWMKKHNDNADISAIPFDFDGQQLSAKSLLAVPMTYAGCLMGFVGLEVPERDRIWPAEMVTLLTRIGEIFINALVHQRTEQTLHKNEEHLRQITDNMLDIICEADAQGIIEFASPSCRKVIGYSPEELQGRSIYEGLHPDEQETVIETMQKLGRAEHRYRHANGEYIWLETLSSVIFDDEGEIKRIIFASRDITYRKRAEHELQELNRLKTDFLSTAAHELRTPLTSIQGFSEILLGRQMDEGRQRRFLTLINEQSLHLHKIIDDLLDVSRLEAKRQLTLTLEPINVATLMNEAALPFLESEANRRFVFERLNDCPIIPGDPMRLLQVGKNLLSNAIKYSPEGSTITVSLRALPDYLQVSIQDQGIGLTPEQQAHLFEKFYRADASNTAVGGTGLGLAICQMIIELHGGKIWVESERGIGSIFHFTLPLTPVQEPAA